MPLTRVGRYRLIDELGSGMFSRVVVGVDDETGLKYAVKVMNKRRLEELNMDQYARREAVVMHKVTHPNIVEFVEAIQSPKKLFLVMKIAPGRELLEVVKDGGVPESDARIYMLQLVDAVACLHDHAFAHRDIKPSNVLIDTATKKLTLIDLGLAGVIRRYSPMLTLCGSDFYKAPETCFGSAHGHHGYDGVKSDAWSVGVLAYILLTGTHPFVDRYGQLMEDNLRTGTLDFPPNMSSSAVSFVSCLLALTPRKRFSVHQIRSHQWLNPSPPELRKPPTSIHRRNGRVSVDYRNGSRVRSGSSTARMGKLFSLTRLSSVADGNSSAATGVEGSTRYGYRTDRDPRKSKGSTSSFLWFRRPIMTDEYGEESRSNFEGSRSFFPRLARDMGANGEERSSSRRTSRDEETRDRSMSIIGAALHSIKKLDRTDDSAKRRGDDHSSLGRHMSAVFNVRRKGFIVTKSTSST